MADEDNSLGDLGGLQKFSGLFGAYGAMQDIETAKTDEEKTIKTQEFIKSFHEMNTFNKAIGLFLIAMFTHQMGSFDFKKLFSSSGRDELEQTLLTGAIESKSNSKLTHAQANDLVSGTLKDLKNAPATQVATSTAPAAPTAGAIPAQTAAQPAATQQTLGASLSANGGFSVTYNPDTHTYIFNAGAQSAAAITNGAQSTIPTAPVTSPSAAAPATAQVTKPAILATTQSNNVVPFSSTSAPQVATQTSTSNTPAESADQKKARLVTEAMNILEPDQTKPVTFESRPELKSLVTERVNAILDEAAKQGFMIHGLVLTTRGAIVEKLQKEFKLTPEQLKDLLTQHSDLLEKAAGADGKLTPQKVENMEKDLIVAAVNPTELGKKVADSNWKTTGNAIASVKM